MRLQLKTLCSCRSCSLGPPGSYPGLPHQLTALHPHCLLLICSQVLRLELSSEEQAQAIHKLTAERDQSRFETAQAKAAARAAAAAAMSAQVRSACAGRV